MNENIERSAPSLPVSKLLEIDKICRQFEAAWEAGKQPRVEDYLTNVPEAQRSELQRELESIDAEYRKSAGPEAFDPYYQWLGIPPKDQPPDHYRLLGVERFEENLNVIENAADQRTTHLRTFQIGKQGDQSQRLLNEVAKAKVCLLQPARKAAYDAKLKQQLQSATAPPLSPRGRGAGGEGAVTPPPVPATKAPPKNRLGEYQLLAKLGSGGMGTVYKARHTKLEKLVALKVLAKGSLVDAEAIARFEREMKAVGQLNHPNIVQALDAREISGTRFLVMEYVDGVNLEKLVGVCGPLPVADACELIRQTALGLDHAHQHGLVHRDIKPSNLMLSFPLAPGGRGVGGEGGQPQVKILDLGLAMFQPGQLSGAERITASGQAMGTIDYMAPEQAVASRDVDIRADLYSLGCTLYKLLSGHAPFSGPKYQDQVNKLIAHARQPVPPIRKVRPDVPAELATVLDRLLAKDPAGRFATPADLVAAIAPLAAGSNLQELSAKARSASAHSAKAASGTHIDTLSNIASQSKPIAPLSPRGRGAGGEGPGILRRLTGFRLMGWLPPRIRVPGWAVAAAGGGAALIVLAIVLYVSTNHGLVKIELSDPKAKVEVKVDGDAIEISGLGEPLQMKAGEHGLTVTSDKFETITQSFTVRRHDLVAIRVTLVPRRAAPAGKLMAAVAPGGASAVGTASKSERPSGVPPVGASAAQRPAAPTPGSAKPPAISSAVPSTASNAAPSKSSVPAGGTSVPPVLTGNKGMMPTPPSVAPSVTSAQSPTPRPAIAPFDEKQAAEYQAAWARYLDLPIEMTNSIGMKFVLIPPGEFMMGSPEGEGKADERPRHRVRISRAFYLGRYEVTQAVYQKVMGNNPSDHKAGPNRPVEAVRWADATSFCRRLTDMEQRNYRLPTEAEWEYCCRAGAQGAYSFGDDPSALKEYAWYIANTNWQANHNADAKQIVGQKKPNPWGLCDMHGNVSEWCSDWYGERFYSESGTDDPTGPLAGPAHVMRGGGWSGSAVHLRSAARARFDSEHGYGPTVGFRAVRAISEQPGKSSVSAGGPGVPAVLTGKPGKMPSGEPTVSNSPVATKPVPAGASPAAVAPPPPAIKTGGPLGEMALVTRPAALPGVRSWTLDTREHRGAITAVAYSPDGKWLATGGQDGTVRLREPHTARVIKVFAGHGCTVNCLVWLSDGKTIASGDSFGVARFWDSETGRMMRMIGHTEDEGLGVIALRISPDGKYVFVRNSHDAYVWDVESGCRLETNGQLPYDEAAWSPRERILAGNGTVGETRAFVLLDPVTGTIHGALKKLRGDPGPSWWSPDGTRLAISYLQGGADIWNTKTGTVVTAESIFGDDKKGFMLAWSPNGRLLANSFEGELCVANTGTRARTSLAARDSSAVRGVERTPWMWYIPSMAWSADSRTLAVAYGRNLELRGLQGKRTRATILSHPTLTDMTWAESTGTLGVGGPSQIVFVGKGRGGEATISQVPGGGEKLAWTPKGDALASCPTVLSDDHALAFWDAASGTTIRKVACGNRSPESMEWSADGKSLLVGSLIPSLWADALPNMVREIPNAFNPGFRGTSSLSPDGKYLATSGSRGLFVLAAANGAPVKTATEEKDYAPWSVSLAWSPNSRWLAASRCPSMSFRRRDTSGASIVNLYEINGEQIKPPVEWKPEPAAKSIDDLGWSPDGKRISARYHVGPTAAKQSCGYAIYDLESRKQVAPLDVPLYVSGESAWSPDGCKFAVASYRTEGAGVFGLAIWDSASGKVSCFQQSAPDSNDPRYAAHRPLWVRWLRDGDGLLSGHGDNTLRRWHVGRAPDTAPARGYPTQIFDGTRVVRATSPWMREARVVVSPDGETAASRSVANTVYLWRTGTGDPLFSMTLLENGQRLLVTPDGHYQPTPELTADLVCIVETEMGQETLSPEAFSQKYGWTNGRAAFAAGITAISAAGAGVSRAATENTGKTPVPPAATAAVPPSGAPDSPEASGTPAESQPANSQPETASAPTARGGKVSRIPDSLLPEPPPARPHAHSRSIRTLLQHTSATVVGAGADKRIGFATPAEPVFDNGNPQFAIPKKATVLGTLSITRLFYCREYYAPADATGRVVESRKAELWVPVPDGPCAQAVADAAGKRGSLVHFVPTRSLPDGVYCLHIGNLDNSQPPPAFSVPFIVRGYGIPKIQRSGVVVDGTAARLTVVIANAGRGEFNDGFLVATLQKEESTRPRFKGRQNRDVPAVATNGQTSIEMTWRLAGLDPGSYHFGGNVRYRLPSDGNELAVFETESFSVGDGAGPGSPSRKESQ